MSMIPQSADAQSLTAASNGVDLPPISQPQPQAQAHAGVDLPPMQQPQGQDLPPSPDDQLEKEKFIASRWYQQMGKAFGSPNTQLYPQDVIDKRKEEATNFLMDQGNSGKLTRSGFENGMGEVRKEVPGSKEGGFSVFKVGVTSNDITPEGWAMYARSTLPPEQAAKYDAQFEQEYNLTKMLKARQTVALNTFKQAGGTMSTLSEKDRQSRNPELENVDLRALQAADKAVQEAGFPPLTPQEKGLLYNIKNGSGLNGPDQKDWFTDTGSDVAGTLARAGFQAAASPGETLLAIGSKIEDQFTGPRALGESNWFSRRLAESEATQQNYAQNYTPQLSNRTDFVNRSLRTIADAAPAMLEMLVTEGASGPRALTRLAAMAQGGQQSAEAARKELVMLAKEQGMSDADAETVGIKGLVIVGPIATAINYVPLHQIIDKNPEIRPLVVRMAASAVTNGAAGTAQNIADQLTRMGLVGKDFSVDELKKAIESGLVVGAAQGLIPSGGGNREPQKEVTPENPAAPAANRVEFKPSFLDEEAAQQPSAPSNQLPIEPRLADNPEFMKSLQDQQTAIQESNRLLEQMKGLPSEPLVTGRLPNNTDLATGKPEHPLISILKQDVPGARQVPETNWSEGARQAAEMWRARGIEPVVAEGENLPQGMTAKSVRGAALIDNARPVESSLKIASHEAGHLLINDEPALKGKILGLIPEADRPRIESQYERSFKAMQERQGRTPEEAQAAWEKYRKTEISDELVASAIHEAVTKDGSVRRAFLGEKGLWGKIRDAFSRVVNSLTKGGRLRNEIASILKDRLNPASKGETFEARGKRIADAYAALKHEPENPAVKKSYDAFKRETLQQFEDLKAQGVKMEPWTKEGQPYKNSAEMTADVKQNKHLYFFTGGELPKDHPLSETLPGSNLTYNDVFRAVHDVYGHALPGTTFGPKGEDKAYQAHSKMYSAEARPAMATETRGQNSFVNYGPNGEHNRANPTNTIYAPQKAGILPDEFHGAEANALPQKSYYSIGHRSDGREELWSLDENGRIATRQGHSHTLGEAIRSPRGRIDHAKLEISISEHPEVSLTEERSIVRQLQDKYPGYSIYKGNERLVGGDEANFMPSQEEETKTLPALDNIRYEAKSPSMTERVKSIINAATDSPVKFKLTLLDKLKRGLQNDFWAVNKAAATAKTRGAGGDSLLPSADPDVLFALVRGGGEALAEQRDSGLRDSQLRQVIDGPTQSPITADWKTQPIVEIAKSHFGDSKRNSVDQAERAVVSTLVAQSTIERGGNMVRRDTVTAMRDKIKSILSGLPGGEALVKRVMTENAPLSQSEKPLTPEQSLRREIKSVKAMVASAKQSLSDMLAMNRKGPSDKLAPEPGTPNLPEQLSKARKQLEILNEFMNRTAKEGHAYTKDLKLGDLKDVFTPAELEQIVNKAEAKKQDVGDAFVRAADDKINRILDSLPPDTLPKYRKPTAEEIAAKKADQQEGMTDEEIAALDEQDRAAAEAKAKQAELQRLNRAKTDIRKRLADSLEMVKAAERGPENGPPIRREPKPVEERIAKASDSLAKLDKILESVQSGKQVEPNEFFTADELATLRRKSLEHPISGIAKAQQGPMSGSMDMQRAEEYLAEVKKSPAWEQIQEAARRYRVWSDAVFQRLVDEGFISKEVARHARDNNQMYVNMQRVMDEAGLGNVYEGTAAVHKFRGSDRLIDNPYVNQDVTSDRLLKASAENKARRAFMDLAGKYPDLAEKADKAGPDTVEVIHDGEKEYWKVDPEIKDALDSLSKYQPEFLGGVLNSFGRMKRWGVTKVPSFIFRNFTRDFQDRLFKGNSGIKDVMHALDQEMIGEMTAAGGSVQRSRAGNSRIDYHKEQRSRIKELASDKSTLLALPSKVWEGYSHLNDVSENANRVAEFNAAKAEAKRKGWSDYDATLYAAAKARGLIDFAVAGSVIRQINRFSYMAFLNGRIQGSTGDFAAIRTRPGKVLMKGFLMGTVPTLAAYAIASAQGKEEEYKALPIWRRMMFNNYYVGTGPVKWVSVPKVPLAALFSAPVEFEIDRQAGRKDALKRIALQGVNIFSPVDDPSVLPASFLLENLTNYSFYYNRNIIPEWERNLPIERRNIEGASNLGKMISGITKSAGWQVDPRYIDNAVSRQFGGTGQMAEGLSNLGSGRPMDTISAFLTRSSGFTAETPGASSPDIADVYQRASEFYDENSPEIKQIASYLRAGNEAKDRADQDAAFAKARDLARKVRETYDTEGKKLQEVGKFNADLNKVQADFKSADTFDKRVEWMKENPDKVKLVRAGEDFDRLYSRLTELRKLRLKEDLPEATRKMADTQIERLYSALANLMAKVQ